MKILEALRTRRSQRSGRDTQTAMSSPDEQQLPISGYDRLKDKQITDQLSQLSQVELATVETYERAHGGRPAVLDKLRYMRGSEPLPGYDALTTEQIAKALAGADAETVKAVRDYERKFGRRQSVLDEAARVLPTATASAVEERAREQQTALVREGFAGRAKTARDLPG
jgi:hypothetical protein